MNKDLVTFMTKNPDWYEEGGFLIAGFDFKQFSAVKHIVKEIMRIAEEQDHHPTVTFSYNTIEVKTVTHDKAGQITEKDFLLAKAISELVVR